MGLKFGCPRKRTSGIEMVHLLVDLEVLGSVGAQSWLLKYKKISITVALKTLLLKGLN